MSLKLIAKALREIGSTECIEKPVMLQKQEFKTSTLNLRNLKLNDTDIIEIASILQHDNNNTLRSISYSYNPLIGDEGASLLANSFPKSINEIGLVGCGIGDAGAIEILHWMKKSTTLKMICIEGNNFSDNVKRDYQTFKKDNPHIMVVF